MLQMLVILDNCVVDRLAESGVDLVADLENTEFSVAYTPDLKIEYENALSSTARTSEQARRMIRSILATGQPVGFFGLDGGPCLGLDRGMFAGEDQADLIGSLSVRPNQRGLPRKRTDAHLVALSRNAIVITANRKEAHWRRTLSGTGRVIQWDHLRGVLRWHHDLAMSIRVFLSSP